MERRRGSAPSRTRSTAGRPPTLMTSGARSTAARDAPPSSRSAWRRPSRIGSSQRSSSSGASATGNVSASGPGPYTGPSTGPWSVVIGRDCSRRNVPVVSIAHSMSWGRPARRSSCTARAASARSSASPGRSPASAVTTLPLRVNVAVQPSTSPLTSRSGPPATADTTIRSGRSLTGSTPKSTPPHAGTRNGCTSTAISTSSGLGRRPRRCDASTSRDRIDERVPTPDIEPRHEHARHRARLGVLLGRRRPHHQRDGGRHR